MSEPTDKDFNDFIRTLTNAPWIQNHLLSYTANIEIEPQIYWMLQKLKEEMGESSE